MWRQVQATSGLPSSGCPLVRCKHAMCTTPDGHWIYLYGGRSLASRPLRDLWRFDVDKEEWEEVLVSTNPANNKTPTYQPPCSGSHSLSSSTTETESSNCSSACSSISTSPQPLGVATHQDRTSARGGFEGDQFGPPPPLQEHTLVAANVSSWARIPMDSNTDFRLF